ncbi:MAG: hypothetical protein ACK55Z_16450, partial [bacterium]
VIRFATGLVHCRVPALGQRFFFGSKLDLTVRQRRFLSQLLVIAVLVRLNLVRVQAAKGHCGPEP